MKQCMAEIVILAVIIRLGNHSPLFVGLEATAIDKAVTVA